MPLTSDANIETYTGIEADIAKRAMARAPAAEREIRDLIGDAAYDDIADASSTNDRNKRLTEAESLITVALALPVMNLAIRQQGGIVVSTGFEGQNSRRLMSITDIREYAVELREQAKALLRSMGLMELDDPEDYDGPPVFAT